MNNITQDIAYLSLLKFDMPTEEWLDFVMQNRTDKFFQHSYDVVYGPVANDKVRHLRSMRADCSQNRD